MIYQPYGSFLTGLIGFFRPFGRGASATGNDIFDSERFVAGVYEPEIMADGSVLFLNGSPIEFGFRAEAVRLLQER